MVNSKKQSCLLERDSLQEFLNNAILTEVVGIEGIKNLRTNQLGLESSLGGGENDLLLHAAVVGSPGDEKEISMLSLLTISELEIEHDETGLVSRQRVDHHLPGILSSTLHLNQDKRALPLSPSQ